MGTLAAGMKEIFASAQTTATHLPTCSSDGTPNGRIAVGDLASVLGGTVNSITGLTDLNEAPLNAVASALGTATNNPIALTGFVYTYCNQKGNNIDYKMQLFWAYSSNRYFNRTQNNTVWSEWKEVSYDVPSFYKSYTDLSSLASALGVWGNESRKQITTTHVVNNGVYYINNSTADKPSDIGDTQYGILIHCCIKSNDAPYHGIQLLCNVNGRLYVRGINAGHYQTWIKITDGVA